MQQGGETQCVFVREGGVSVTLCHLPPCGRHKHSASIPTTCACSSPFVVLWCAVCTCRNTCVAMRTKWHGGPVCGGLCSYLLYRTPAVNSSHWQLRGAVAAAGDSWGVVACNRCGLAALITCAQKLHLVTNWFSSLLRESCMAVF